MKNLSRPLISVITVVFNGGKYIEETILSIKNQSYENIEFIIVDGGSTDNTINIIKKYDYLVNKWVSEPDEGIYFAMNKGANFANGSYICFLNSSDGYFPNTIENFVSKLAENDFDYTFGPASIVDESGTEVRISYPLDYKRLISKKYLPMPSPHLAVFLKKSLFMDLGGYDTSLYLSADYDFLLRMIKASKKVHYLSQPVGFFKLGGASNSIKSHFENYKVMRTHGVNIFLRFLLTSSSVIKHLVKKVIPSRILMYIQSQNRN